jgi:hypothetical protein
MAPYATAATLRTQYLVQLNTGTSEEIAAKDATLNTFLVNATSIVEAALGFAFEGYDELATARRVRSYGGAYITLPPHLAGSITAVAWGGSVVDGTTWIETPSGMLERVSSDVLLTSWAGCWSEGFYSVTARWGYGDPPSSIVEVVCELAVNIWRSRDKGSFTEVIGTQGSGYLKVVGALTGAQREVIEAVKSRYREQAV